MATDILSFNTMKENAYSSRKCFFTRVKTFSRPMIKIQINSEIDYGLFMWQLQVLNYGINALSTPSTFYCSFSLTLD